MHILIVSKNRIPVYAYGGTERVVWDLGFSLTKLGHKVTYLVKSRSQCDFADVLTIEKKKSLLSQVEVVFKRVRADIIHFQSNIFPDLEAADNFSLPYIMTEHGNSELGTWHPRNTVFISKNHAERHKSEHFVYNGLNWEAYGKVDFSAKRKNFHFLGNVAWPVKNFKGAVDVACQAKIEMDVLGGKRLQIRRGFRFTRQSNIHFHGMVGGLEKFRLLNNSRGMIFPVMWYEPFGLAIIESLYFGCPVFATPYGAISELVPVECGFLSNSCGELVHALGNAENYSKEYCHSYVSDNFNALTMAKSYIKKYEKVLDKIYLHDSAPISQMHPRDLPWVP